MLSALAAAGWHTEVTRAPCAMCAAFPVSPGVRMLRGPDLMWREGHHIIPRRWLRRLGLSAFMWDVENGLSLCRYHHGRHELAVERVPASLLPTVTRSWAASLGLLWLLDRLYPPGDR